MAQEVQEAFRSGFAALIGAPNVGKSTLLNRMLGEKVSIVSRKPQTTRNRILGVAHLPAAQIVLLDTPGIHKADVALNRHMVEVAFGAVSEVDVIVFVIDASRPDPDSEALVLERLKTREKPVILAVNKVDAVKKPDLLPILDRWKDAAAFDEIVPLSALDGTQVEVLTETMARHLPEGPPYFPEDTLTDATERFIAAEMIREQVFLFTGQEIPYATAVTIQTFKERQKPPLVTIDATIHVERNSQKGIVIGKGGEMLKRIGMGARREIEAMLGCKVLLKLFVRVEKNWSRDPQAMRRLGYE